MKKDYFEEVYNIGIVVHMCSFNGIQRGNYFRELKNEKAKFKDEVIGEIVKGGGDKVVD